MDESGLLEGQGSNGLVLGSREKVAVRRKQPGSRAWTSFVECISATGKALPPLVIFKGESVQQQWFPKDLRPYASWEFTATQKGWITDATAVEWLEKVYIPGSKPADPSEPRLLVVDGHGSHESTDFMWLCFKNNIHLLFLPPHTSHVLQPLDLAVFSALKTAYRKELGNLISLTDFTAVGKRGFLDCYRRASLTSQNIRSGWKATGLWPVTLAKPLLSRLLLENSNKAPILPVNSDTPGMASSLSTPKAISKGSLVVWATPRKARDLRDQLGRFGQSIRTTTTQRHLFQKVQKAFDEKDAQLATSQAKIVSLEAQVEAGRARKRRKVQTSPNSKFANIEAIYRAQLEVGEAGDNPIESSESDLSSEAGECIVVGEVVVLE
jgi:4-hydroxybenzoate polyprenyltransferase